MKPETKVTIQYFFGQHIHSGSTGSDRVEVTVSIDTSLPVTSLQIRLADGTRYFINII